MPSGYTEGIISGKTKTFADFAKLCARAFGATIHMRDDLLSTPYQERVPSDYHKNELEDLAKKSISGLTDEELLERKRQSIQKSIEHNESSLKDKQEKLERLNDFLESAKQFTPPTQEHTGIKDFMIKQIEETISWDCDTDYNIQALIDLKTKLENLDVDEIRKEEQSHIDQQIAYHTEELKKEEQRCADSNLWVKQYYEAIEGTKKTA